MKRRAFTRTELLIVIAVVVVIALISIPNLLRSRVTANEAAAIYSLRLVHQAEKAYRDAHGEYATNFAALASTFDPLLSKEENAAVRYYMNRYTLRLSGTTDNFTCNADPARMGKDGHHGYFVDSSGVVRRERHGVATAASSPLGE